MYYIVINQTKGTSLRYSGEWYNLDECLNKGEKIVVISMYSNTIKVPHLTVLNGINEWEWEDFPLSIDLIVEGRSCQRCGESLTTGSYCPDCLKIEHKIEQRQELELLAKEARESVSNEVDDTLPF